MSESMIDRGVAAIEKLVIGDHGCYSDRCSCSGLAAFECKTGLRAQDVARAVIEAMREPTEEMLERGLMDGTNLTPSGPSDRLAARTSGERMRDQWRGMIHAALIWPAGSADIAGVPMAKD